MKCIRVLHINAGSKAFGGVSAFCLNIYRNIDRKRVQFDFLTPNKTTYGQFRKEIEQYGGTIYERGIDAKTIFGKIKLARDLKVFLKNNKYDIIHVNSGILSFNCVVAKVCKESTNSKVFVHSHSNGGRSEIKELLSGVLKHYVVKKADCLLACSESAAKYMFPLKAIDKTEIINNGVITEEFKYNPSIRKALRDALQIDDQFVIGHVGRFTPPKNHKFLIELFCEVKKKKKDAVLMLVGEGPLMQNVRELAQSMNIADSVYFLGARKDVNELYQAMDVFVLPSIWEGFGIVNIEAQTTGLKCVTSTVVPKDVDVTGNVVQLDLKAPIELWVKEVLDTPIERRDYSEIVKEKGFDIRTSTDRLTLLYEGAVRN